MAAEDWSGLAQLRLDDHEIHLFCETIGVPLGGPRTRLDQVPALRECGDRPIWRQTTADLAPEFFGHPRAIVSGRRPDLATTWTLAEPASELTEKRLRLTCGGDAGNRSSAAQSLPRVLTLSPETITLYVFVTGKSFVQIRTSLACADANAAPSAVALLAAVAAFGRSDSVRWETSADGDAPEAGLPLRRLIRQLVHGVAAEGNADERLITYTYAQFAEPLAPAAAERFAAYLARQCPPDRRLGPALPGVERSRDPETTVHAVALEGAATIAAPSPDAPSSPADLADFKIRTVRRHYVPLVLLALHEHGFLVDRTSQSVLTSEAESRIRGTMQTLARLRSASLVFRVYFRFSQVSPVTAHNELYQAFRRALDLDRLLRDLAGDVSEVDSFIRAAEQQKAQTRYYWISVIGGAAVGAYYGYTAVRDFADYLVKKKGSVPIHIPQSVIENWQTVTDIAAIVIAAVVCLGAVWLIGRRRPLRRTHGHGDQTMRMMLAQVSEDAMTLAAARQTRGRVAAPSRSAPTGE